MEKTLAEILAEMATIHDEMYGIIRDKAEMIAVMHEHYHSQKKRLDELLDILVSNLPVKKDGARDY